MWLVQILCYGCQDFRYVLVSYFPLFDISYILWGFLFYIYLSDGMTSRMLAEMTISSR